MAVLLRVPAHVAKGVGDDILRGKLAVLQEERHVADDHVEVAVAPVRVLADVLLEDRAEGGLVLGDEPRPLFEHEAHRLDDDGRVADGQVERVAQAHAEELREPPRPPLLLPRCPLLATTVYGEGEMTRTRGAAVYA